VLTSKSFKLLKFKNQRPFELRKQNEYKPFRRRCNRDSTRRQLWSTAYCRGVSQALDTTTLSPDTTANHRMYSVVWAQQKLHNEMSQYL